MNSQFSVAAIVVCLLFCNVVLADVVWDENVDGQLSNQPGAATFLDLVSGSNLVIGDLGPDSPQNSDFFWFEIATNQALESIVLIDYDVANTSRFDTFFGPSAGTPFDGFVSTDFNSQSIGTDLLSGVGPTLFPGQYSVALQEFDNPTVNYVIEINVSAVPEPCSAVVSVLAIGMMSIRRRRQKCKSC